MAGGTGQETIVLAGGGDLVVVEAKAALFHLGAEKLRGFGCIAAEQVERKALKIRGARDIHGRRRGCHGLCGWARPVVSGAEELIQHIILIGSHDKTINGKAHLASDVAGTDIAKVTGGNAKGNLLIGGLGDLEPAGNVVDHLGHQPCPVNGIDRANAVGGLKVSISRYRLDHILAIIENAI